MYYVYLLKSKKEEGFYIGYTNDLRQRFKEHQTGYVKSTKHRRPLSLIYYEAYEKSNLAREREKQLKRFGSSYYGMLKRLKLE